MHSRLAHGFTAMRLEEVDDRDVLPRKNYCRR